MSVGLYLNDKVQSLDTKIDKLVTVPNISVAGISLDNTILIHPLANNAAIPKNLSMEAISKVYEENFDELKAISLAGEEILGGATIGDDTGFKKNRLNLLDKSIKYIRQDGTDNFYEEDNMDDFVWEYDCMNAYMHIIPYKFTLDRQPKPITLKATDKTSSRMSVSSVRRNCIIQEPLRVQTIDFGKHSSTSGTSIFYHKSGNYYLNATVANEYKYVTLMKTDRVLKRLAASYNERYKDLGENLDFTKLVYGLYLSGIFLKMPKQEAKRLKEVIKLIGTVVSEYVLTNSKVRKARIGSDGIITKEPWDDEFTHKLYRVKHRIPRHTDIDIIESFKNTYRVNEIAYFTDRGKLPSVLGWYSADIETILKNYPGWKAFHIDIHAAYVSLAKSLADITISKNEAGKLASSDPYLFHNICNIVSQRSMKLASYYEEKQQVVYWQTDGGICLIKEDVDVSDMMKENPDVVIEQVVGRTAHKLSKSLNIDFLKGKQLSANHIFAYTIFVGESKKTSELKVYYANNFESYFKDIVKVNNITGLAGLDTQGVIKVVSTYKKKDEDE